MRFTSKWLCGRVAVINCPLCWERHNILVGITDREHDMCVFVPQCVCVTGSHTHWLLCTSVYKWYSVYDINTSRETHSCRVPCPLRSEPEMAGETYARLFHFKILFDKLCVQSGIVPAWPGAFHTECAVEEELQTYQVPVQSHRMAAVKGTCSDLNTYQAGLEQGSRTETGSDPLCCRSQTLPLRPEDVLDTSFSNYCDLVTFQLGPAVKATTQLHATSCGRALKVWSLRFLNKTTQFCKRIQIH